MIRLSPLFTKHNRDAIRLDKKRHTRRVAKPQPAPEFLARGVVAVVPQWPAQDGVRWFMADGLSELRRSPHGKPGDVWGMKEPLRKSGSGMVVYGDDGTPVWVDGAESTTWQWKRDILTSMFMPKWAARTFRTITDVRIERVQDISEADVWAEGLDQEDYEEWREHVENVAPSRSMFQQPRDLFFDVWDQINGKRPGCSVADNPWNFVYVFRPATPAEVEAAQ